MLVKGAPCFSLRAKIGSEPVKSSGREQYDYFTGVFIKTHIKAPLSECCIPIYHYTNFTAQGSTNVYAALRWRHNERDSVSNHQPHDCLLNGLFRRRSKKTSKLRVTGLCVGNSPGPVNSPHKGPVTRKMFPFDDVIMGRTGQHQRMTKQSQGRTVCIIRIIVR